VGGVIGGNGNGMEGGIIGIEIGREIVIVIGGGRLGWKLVGRKGIRRA
jgi:hypothetical protein